MRQVVTAALTATMLASTVALAGANPEDSTGAPPAPAPAVPDFTPRTGQPAPTAPPDSFFYSHAYTMTFGEPSVADGDSTLDAMLGVLPQAPADREPVYYFFETEDGGQGCVRLDTLVPEPC